MVGAKRTRSARTAEEAEEGLPESVIIQLCSAEGEKLVTPMDLKTATTSKQLQSLVQQLIPNEEKLPYSFHLTSTRTPIAGTIGKALVTVDVEINTETIISITYEPVSIFKVRAVSRCTATLPGHSEAILSCAFSPDSSLIATGSGDTTVRLWKSDSQLPDKTLTGHMNWVLALAFSPDSKKLASASKDGTVRLWDMNTKLPLGGALRGHKKWITCLAWEPYHLDDSCTRLVTGSKDGKLRVWNTRTFTCTHTLSGHTSAVTCLRWSGEGVIYSASQDRTIKVWDIKTGLPIKSIQGHGHWVNTMVLSTDGILKCGAFRMLDEDKKGKLTMEEARERYERIKGKSERMISGSDDFTLILWQDLSKNLEDETKYKTRMHGHQQAVNDLSYSSDGRYVASASFDKSVRIWDGITGKFIATLRGHVGPVFQVAWSADSRLVLSASKDSTCKVWDARTGKIVTDLPGHADEVYTIDWSADAKLVVSGGKDKAVRLWRH